MSTVIAPTPGRIIWFRPAPTENLTQIGNPDGSEGLQPLAASVLAVNADGTINIAGHDALGSPFYRHGVILAQDGDEKPNGSYAEWMPYQKSQAAKAEQPVPDTALPKAAAGKKSAKSTASCVTEGGQTADTTQTQDGNTQEGGAQ